MMFHCDLGLTISHPEGHLWKLGCQTGVLDQWYSRNQFQSTLEKFMSVSDVALEMEVSLRSAAKQESMGGGQGFFFKVQLYRQLPNQAL